MSARTKAFGALLVGIALVSACDDEYVPPKVPTTHTQKEASPTERREAACKATELPASITSKASDGSTDVPQGNIARVEVEGVADEATAKKAIGLAAGDAITLQKTQDAVRHLFALGDADDVRLEGRTTPQGVVLHFTVQKRPSYGEIVIHGGTIYDAPELEKALHATGGATYNPVALISARSTLVDGLRQRGYSDATLKVVGARSGDAIDLCVDLHEGMKVTIDSVTFKGLTRIKEEELRSAIDTDHGRINAAGGVIDQTKIDEAVAKMAESFDSRGLAKGTIATKTQRNGDKVSLVFEVEEGPVVSVRRYEVKGDLVTDLGTYHRLLSLKSKDAFSRAKLVSDIQKINDLHEKKGRKDLVVQPETQVDDAQNKIDVILVVVDPKKAKLTPPPPPAKK